MSAAPVPALRHADNRWHDLLLLALHVKGLPVRHLPAHPRWPDRFVLHFGRLVFTDAAAALRHLEQHYPEPPLFPCNARQRACMLELFDLCASTNLVQLERYAPTPERCFLFGNRPCIADLYLAVWAPATPRWQPLREALEAPGPY